ncbi:hypothetical protein COY52_09520 [Candidatus Desantisbacteria bacterium CG_4_10_14_0_8_um_filter_48_22]|uniref:Methionine synthase n=1 Tax=Candidatus Desantisbacteria bacterium CG_4_10_14_0_8_um_filter_48_22 TaxID=1974543 RepID=A0A2M7S7Q0_9BACT|nr:MAG: hypothetical protein COY52_09520 [Candidatus Desantisbacteria bacterium CG_4_10_14_0_8_um_filter_48_22]PJB28371.1 MAG: hypothetical protein CO111_01805 [Candidatus Desantisbacteria bacterium CG_4_9_14_3_um_filter_50_7]
MANDELIKELLGVKCKATGIGSLPCRDVSSAVELVLCNCPDLPYWPQLARVDPRENMFLQFSERLPCLKPDLEKKSVRWDASVNREQELVRFYENLLAKNYGYFRISPDFARGLYALLDKAGTLKNKFIKGQVIGPVTFLSSITGADGKFLIYDEEITEASVKGLGAKAVWQAEEIKKAGKLPIIFFDEPYLSSLGSAHFPVSREKAIELLNGLIDFVKEQENALIGIHCCGNTDWSLVLDVKIDILSFDAFGYSGNFVLYPDNIKKFLGRGGMIAWGIVPTTEYKKGISVGSLSEKLDKALKSLAGKGVDRNTVLKNSLFTPSCGMGTLDEKDSTKILELCRGIADLFSSAR